MNNKPSTSCDKSQIAGFLAGTISPDQQTLLESHLEMCDDCQRTLEESASETAVWKSAGKFLRDDDHDGAVSSIVAVATAPEHSSEWNRIQATVEIRSTDSASAVVIRQIIGWLDPTDDPRMLGRIGSYEIAGVIGAGGMGVVLKGFDAALNRYVAIKLLAPHLAGNGASRQRFAREAQAAAAVVHENVIAIHSVSEFNDLPYLVMPYVKGQSLQKRLDTHGPLDVAEVLRIGMQTASGLAAAHAQGLVHRDIKPANILLIDGVSRVAITDFGLARAADDASLTNSGAIAGTPQYMSPEQASGQSVDHRSDLFSLGSVMYAMFAGRPPFRAESAYGILKRIAEETARPLQDINANVPGWLVGVIERLHSRDPNRRFQTATEVELVLADCLAHVQQPHQVDLPPSVAKLTPTRSSMPWPWPAGVLATALFGMFCWWQFIDRPTTDGGHLSEEVAVAQPVNEFESNPAAFAEPDSIGDEVTGEFDGVGFFDEPAPPTATFDSTLPADSQVFGQDNDLFFESPEKPFTESLGSQSIQNEIDALSLEFMQLESEVDFDAQPNFDHEELK